MASICSTEPLIAGHVIIYNNPDSEDTAATNDHVSAADNSTPRIEMKDLTSKNQSVSVMVGAGDKLPIDEPSQDCENDVDSPFSRCLQRAEDLRRALTTFLHKHKHLFQMMLAILIAVVFLAYFVWAMVLNYRKAMPLIVFTCCIVTLGIYYCSKQVFGAYLLDRCISPCVFHVKSQWTVIKWMCIIALVIVGLALLALSVGSQPRQLISLLGLFFFFSVLFIFSTNPAQVKFRPVIWGLVLQFFLGLLILRTHWGYVAFQFLGQQIQTFLNFSNAGAMFVFGEKYTDHIFAFQVLPVIVFFSSVISIMYYVGLMQILIGKIAAVMQFTMKTTATESLTAAGNIFVGQTEAPILIRPFIKDMTKSELHAMMTAGFATIAGGVLAAYIFFGVPPEHLLCASVMNAPIALAVSKLSYPETEESKSKNGVQLEKGKERNLLEAASNGASASISLVANIAANLIAFMAILSFVNSALSWLGSMVGHPELSFQLVCSYVFMPLAFLMGVEWRDCSIVAELLGIKTFINEFVAYRELATIIENRNNCVQPFISTRSEIIVTYALCGFANVSSIGIQLGGIGPMAPSRKGDLAEIAVRALCSGTIACFITACVAGILTPEEALVSCDDVIYDRLSTATLLETWAVTSSP